MPTIVTSYVCCERHQHEPQNADAIQSIRHLNQTDLARRWRLSTRTLERWRWLGQGPAFLKLGGRVAYRVEDVEAFEAAQRQEMRAG